MKRFLGAALAATLVTALAGPARADDPDAQAIVDKGIQALGGAEKLGKAAAFSVKTKATIRFNDNDNDFRGQVTVQGLDHYRSQFESDMFTGVTVLAGDKGWRRFGDNPTMELEGDALANEKRNVYLYVVPRRLVPLKGQGFKVQAAGEQQVDGKPAVGVKVTGPDGKDATIYFDKQSGLPVKQVATVVGFQGQEYTQETTYADYKDFDGIKVATKAEVKRDGDRFLTQEVTEFKALDKVDPDTFTEPK